VPTFRSLVERVIHDEASDESKQTKSSKWPIAGVPQENPANQQDHECDRKSDIRVTKPAHAQTLFRRQFISKTIAQDKVEQRYQRAESAPHIAVRQSSCLQLPPGPSHDETDDPHRESPEKHTGTHGHRQSPEYGCQRADLSEGHTEILPTKTAQVMRRPCWNRKIFRPKP
jgi:hypothetical protein